MRTKFTTTLLLIFFSSAICLTGCKKDEDKPIIPAVGELDGTWTAKNYWTMQIIGDQGFVVDLFDANTAGGLLRKDDSVIRNLQKLDDSIWKGEEIVYRESLKALIWVSAIYKLNSSKTEFISFMEEYDNIVYYKINDSSNPFSVNMKEQNVSGIKIAR